MDAPKCKICGERHNGTCLGHVSKRVASVAKAVAEASAKATIDAKRKTQPVKAKPGPKGYIAPHGECPYCDARRDATRLAVERHRKRHPAVPK